MNSRILRNRSTFGFYSPQQKNLININEVEIFKDKILKLKIELNKKNIECQELRVMYNKLDKMYKSNISLMGKLINEANNSIINTNLSYDKEKEKQNEKNKEINDINKLNSQKNISKSLESNKNVKNTTFNKSFLFYVNKNHLTLKLQQEISELKNEINEKDIIIKDLKNNANGLRYKELDKKYAKIYLELIQTRENNEKLEAYCLSLNSKINQYKEKIKKINNKIIQLEDENIALKKKLTKYENIQGNLVNSKDEDKNIYQKKNNFGKDGDIEKLKEKSKELENENKK